MKKVLAFEESGLTLVEVLAAMVIMGIIFTGFMTIFPQMTNFNEKTEVKLDTMSQIREELTIVLNNGKWDSDSVPASADTDGDGTLETEEFIKHFIDDVAQYDFSSTQPVSGSVRYLKNGDYRYEVDVSTVCTPLVDETTCVETDSVKLFKVHLKAFNGTLLSSETYGYASLIQ